MKGLRGVYFLPCLALLFGMFGGLAGTQVVLAAQESSNNSISLPPGAAEPPSEESLDLVSEYPVIHGESGDSFEYVVVFDYKTAAEEEARVFDITTIEPPGWQATVKKQYGDTGETIRAMRLNPNMPYPDRLKVTFSPLPDTEPEPSDYILTVEATSGDVKGTIELKAVVTGIPPTHELALVTNTGRLDTIAKSGEDNTLTLKLTNLGTGTVEDISFTSDKAEGWGITFDPNSIESLDPGESQEVEATIIPPNRTIAGDYSITLTARGSDNSFDRVILRVSVQTPTAWGGAGIAIIAGVITGLVFLFRRLGRR
jgi:uncharacterized membrane protein